MHSNQQSQHGQYVNPAGEPKVFLIGAAALLAIAAALSLGHALRHGDHNEQMYVAAGELVASGKLIYRDFGIVQMPYLPMLYGGMFWLLGDVDHLLLARLFNWLVWFVGAIAIFAIARRAGHNQPIACAFAIFYLVNPIMLRITHEASNYALPATLSLLQALLVMRAQGNAPIQHAMLRIVLVGLLGGLAVGVKLYYLPVVLPYVLLAGFAAGWGFSAKAIAMAATAFCCALLPTAVLWVCVPTSFVFYNLQFHGLTTATYRVIGTEAPMTILQKANFIRASLLTNIAACFSFLFIAWGCHIRSLRGFRDERPWFYCLAAALCSAVLGLSVALFMTPSWPQYLALSMPYILVAAIISLRWVPSESASGRNCVVWIGTMLCFAAFVNPKDVVAICSPGTHWQPLVLRANAKELARRVRDNHDAGKVATVQPLYAIAAGLPFYPEFAAGPFVYAVADMLSDEKQKQFVAVGRRRLTDVLDADPPAAILAGFYPEASMFDDKLLVSYAEQRGYKKSHLNCCPELTLYLRSESAIRRGVVKD